MDNSTMVVCEADKTMLNPDLNASDNRMAAGQGWSYDAAGNVIADPQGRSFIYDAENKQVEVENSLEQSIGEYWHHVQGSDLGFEPSLTVGPPTQTGGWKILLPFRERVGGHPNPGFHPGLLSSSPSATAEPARTAGRLKPGQPESGIRNDECGIWAKEGTQNRDSAFIVHRS
ncbi:MAG: hypothetical protein KF831_10075 [Acidobacteria bacterium]|nr:hypothetical protein [Acidobacteriota bacterium]